jgi:hypothetical protein
MTVKCDWLDVTYAPNDTPENDVFQVIQTAGAECRSRDGSDTTWFLNYGVLKVEYRKTHARFSASGAFLDGLRGAICYMDYLSALAGSPHTVTRLDAAHDVPKDTPAIIKALHKRYPQECNFTRKPLRTKRILETRPDGLESGTWYAGHKQKGMVTGRVYDKRLQLLNVQGIQLPMPQTRYELTFRKAIQATLHDAATPERLFWQYATPLLLKRPVDVPEWVSGWGGGWHHQREETCLPALLKQRLESSSELQAIATLAVQAGCEDWAKQLLARIFEKHLKGDGTVDTLSAPASSSAA